MNIEALKYPVGKYEAPELISDDTIDKWINEIETLPNKLKSVATTLTKQELNTPYRPDGWTVRQVIHHLADSHVNAYVRFHLALTETNPTIKPYLENEWAELNYMKELDIDVSLNIITSIHTRLVLLLKSLTHSDLEKTYLHPQYNKQFKLSEVIGLYAWHGKHHLAHMHLVVKPL